MQRKRAETMRQGATLRALREAYGWRHANFASAVGISRGFLSNIEAGRRGINPELAHRMAATLGVPLAAITTHAEPDAVSADIVDREPPTVSLQDVRAMSGMTLDDVVRRLAQETGEQWTSDAILAIEYGLQEASADLLDALCAAYGLRVGAITADRTPVAASRQVVA